MIKEDLESFLDKNDVIPKEHHGGRPYHSTVTAKAIIDLEINKLRDKNKSVAITTTDLSAAFDTCDAFLLLMMLEHVGIKNTELEIFTTYLTGQKAYVEVQGFASRLIDMPDCLVVQGSKLSTTLYTVYTLDSTDVATIMNDKEHFKEVVGKDPDETEEIEHNSIGYIDDVTHVTGAESKETQEVYLNNLYSLLVNVYSNKKLQINGSKTQFLTIQKRNDDNYKIKINISDTESIEESNSIRILGFVQNKRNTLDTHMNWVSSKVCMTLAKLKPILGYLNESQRKRIIEAKVKSVALYGSQLILGQPQQVIQRACAILMRINRAMFNNTEGFRSTTSICRRLKIDEPRQNIIKSSLKQIHKIIEAKKPKHILSNLKLPSRKSGKIYIRGGTRSACSERSPINAAIALYNAIPSSFRVIRHKKLKAKLKRIDIDYSLFK